MVGRLRAVRVPRALVVLAVRSLIVLVPMGLVVLGLVAYQHYSRLRSGSDAARFEVGVPTAERAALTLRSAPAAAVGSPTAEVEDSRGSASGSAVESPVSLAAAAPSPDALDLASVYPANLMNPKYWDDSGWAGSLPFGGPGLPEGYEPVSSLDGGVVSGVAGSAAFRILIPAVGLDSGVMDLGIIDLGDYLAYETPDNTVGHIPDSANPGELSRGWYFGHLRSILQGEGSVFHRLPEISSLIMEDPVDVTLVTADGEYLYRVVATELLHEDDLHLTRAADSRITLVTCWPPNVYDRRILVHAELIALKRVS